MSALIKEVSADADGGFEKVKKTLKPVTNFSKDARIVRFHALAGKNVEKILIVSDFINKIG